MVLQRNVLHSTKIKTGTNNLNRLKNLALNLSCSVYALHSAGKIENSSNKTTTRGDAARRSVQLSYQTEEFVSSCVSARCRLFHVCIQPWKPAGGWVKNAKFVSNGRSLLIHGSSWTEIRRDTYFKSILPINTSVPG